MNHYVIEELLKEKRRDMLQESERLRLVREYETSLKTASARRRNQLYVSLLGNLEIALGNMLIRAGVWLTKRQLRRGCVQGCEG